MEYQLGQTPSFDGQNHGTSSNREIKRPEMVPNKYSSNFNTLPIKEQIAQIRMSMEKNELSLFNQWLESETSKLIKEIDPSHMAEYRHVARAVQNIKFNILLTIKSIKTRESCLNERQRQSSEKWIQDNQHKDQDSWNEGEYADFLNRRLQMLESLNKQNDKKSKEIDKANSSPMNEETGEWDLVSRENTSAETSGIAPRQVGWKGRFLLAIGTVATYLAGKVDGKSTDIDLLANPTAVVEDEHFVNGQKSKNSMQEKTFLPHPTETLDGKSWDAIASELPTSVVYFKPRLQEKKKDKSEHIKLEKIDEFAEKFQRMMRSPKMRKEVISYIAQAIQEHPQIVKAALEAFSQHPILQNDQERSSGELVRRDTNSDIQQLFTLVYDLQGKVAQNSEYISVNRILFPSLMGGLVFLTTVGLCMIDRDLQKTTTAVTVMNQLLTDIQQRAGNNQPNPQEGTSVQPPDSEEIEMQAMGNQGGNPTGPPRRMITNSLLCCIKI